MLQWRLLPLPGERGHDPLICKQILNNWQCLSERLGRRALDAWNRFGSSHEVAQGHSPQWVKTPTREKGCSGLSFLSKGLDGQLALLSCWNPWRGDIFGNADEGNLGVQEGGLHHSGEQTRAS